MKKLSLALVVAQLLCGCGDADWHPLDCWEYQLALPQGTTHEQLMAIETNLRSNGYERVKFITERDGWTGKPVGMSVYATRRKEK